MTGAYDIAGFRAAIGDIKIEDNPTLVKQKSRDFYWYSPVLKRELEHVTADLMVTPKSEDEVRAVLAAAYKFGVPVTPRGAGDRQLRAGDAAHRRRAAQPHRDEPRQGDRARPRRLRARRAADRHRPRAAPPRGQELRMFPSTRATASVAGFVAGGSGGVGSITWGGLRDFGNVIRLRVLTMEESPRALELTGADLHKAVHAYGTNGIITEVEMPLAPRYDWVDVIVGFEDFEAAAAYGAALGAQDGILQEAHHRGRRARAARLFPAPSFADPGRRRASCWR